jgi:hypothetical protein
MNLKVKFALISGLPLLGLCVAILASYLLAQSIEHKTRLARDKNVTFADCARRMQLDVVQVQQWLTDISATRGQDGLDDGFKEAEESHKSFLANLNKFRAEFQLEQNDEELRKLADLEKNFEAYYEKGRIMAAAYIKDGPTAGNQIMSEFDATASYRDFESICRGRDRKIPYCAHGNLRLHPLHEPVDGPWRAGYHPLGSDLHIHSNTIDHSSSWRIGHKFGQRISSNRFRCTPSFYGQQPTFFRLKRTSLLG